MTLPPGHLVCSLFDDPQALPHLLHPYEVAGITVSSAGRWNVELEMVISGVGEFFLRSHSRPQALRFGPVTPHSMAAFSDSVPIPSVRALKMGFFVMSDSYSFRRPGNILAKSSTASLQPSGRSAANPRSETRTDEVAARNVFDEIHGASRARERYRKGRGHRSHIMGKGPEPDEGLLIRKNSVSITRTNWARSGTWIPANVSTEWR